jgi:hypothetical protein
MSLASRSLSAVASLALGLGIAGPSASAAESYSFSTPEDLENWQYEYERWRVEDGSLLQPEADGYREVLWLPTSAFSNLDLSFDFRIEPADVGFRSVGLIYRAQSATEYDWVQFEGRQSIAGWYRSSVVREANSGSSVSVPQLTLGSWHTARVVATGNLHEVYLDGTKVLTRTDSTFASGVIGLRTGQATAQFRNLNITGTSVALPPQFQVPNMPYLDVATDAGAGGYEAFPDVTRTSSGDLLAVFYGGYKHVPSTPTPDLPNGGRVSMVRSLDNGLTWSQPQTVLDTAADDHDPTINQLSDGRLVVAVCSWPVENTHKPYLVWSNDNGHTWGAPKRLDVVQPLAATEVPSGPIVELGNGTMLMATYGTVNAGDPYTSAVVRRSTDSGATWTFPSSSVLRSTDPNDPNVTEPSLVRLPDDRLLMIARQKMFWSESTDDGYTWSPLSPMPLRGDSPYLLLTSDDILLCGIRYRGDANGRNRGTALIQSLDFGQTWSDPFMLAPVIGGYTSMVELDDGRIFVTYYTEGDGSDIRGAYVYSDVSGIRFAPIPEPAGLAMSLLGFGYVVRRRCQR